MDFFERAHVSNEGSKRSTQQDLIVKKQLKQMLKGYKQSDNKIIQEATTLKTTLHNPVQEFDDSTSVSGFSDLNLTNSSLEDNLNTQGDISLETDDISQADTDVDESVLKCDEMQSLSEVSEKVSHIKSDSDDASLIVSLEDSEIMSTASDEFDADGALACKILKRLKKKEFDAKRKKQKIEADSDSNTENVESDTQTTNACKIKRFNEPKKESFVNTETSDSVQSNDIISLTSSAPSSPFVSVTANDMPAENLDEILGGYCHPVVKNLPSENYTNTNDGFSTEIINDSDILIEEDVDSLVPELGDVPVIDELEEIDNPKEMDTTIDETMQSENISELGELVYDFQNASDSIQIYYGTKHCIFVLKHPAIFYFHGKVEMRALGGQMEVFGCTLKDKCYDMYAPRFNYALSVKTIESPNNYQGLFGKLTALGISVTEAEDIVTTLGEYDGILSLGPLSDPRMDFVEDNFNVCEVFTKTKNVEPYFHRASDFLGCSLYLKKPLRTYEERSEWENAVTCGQEPGSRGIVCGGKGTGKSTVLRYLCNRLLDSGPVLVIDLDPGQAEFTVAGNLSVTVIDEPIIGPNFTHLKTPEKMLNIGMISPMDNKYRYISAVEEIISYCHQTSKYSTMPWIINTMGMCNEIGLTFMLMNILAVKPTYLCQIYSKSAKKQFECNFQPHNVQKLYRSYKHSHLFRNYLYPKDLNYSFMSFVTITESSNQPRRAIPLKPGHERYLNFLAYFGELLNVHKVSSILNNAPYSVNLKDVNIGLNMRVNNNCVSKVINGKIIALCKLTTNDRGRIFTLTDKAIPCLGNGLVRGIDFENEVLYILTPLPFEILSQVNTLVYSDWAPEIVGQEKYLPDNTTVPYRTTFQPEQREFMMPPRRRFNPLMLLNMQRKT